jgi:hypothetical protein
MSLQLSHPVKPIFLCLLSCDLLLYLSTSASSSVSFPMCLALFHPLSLSLNLFSSISLPLHLALCHRPLLPPLVDQPPVYTCLSVSFICLSSCITLPAASSSLLVSLSCSIYYLFIFSSILRCLSPLHIHQFSVSHSVSLSLCLFPYVYLLCVIPSASFKTNVYSVFPSVSSPLSLSHPPFIHHPLRLSLHHRSLPFCLFLSTSPVPLFSCKLIVKHCSTGGGGWSVETERRSKLE